MKSRYKNAVCIMLLFAAMFFTGWKIAKVQTDDTIDAMNQIEQAENWGLGFGAEGTQPTGTVTAEELKQYNAYYVGDSAEKVIYLTFDCGYEKG